jgi:Uma2 family endonuclease
VRPSRGRDRLESITAASPDRVSYEEYLHLEDSNETKHEWSDGVVYAMSRGTTQHGRLTSRVSRLIGFALGQECEVFSSDTMLFVEAARLSTMRTRWWSAGRSSGRSRPTRTGRRWGEAITNPTILVEVLSDSTERYDRDGKFQAYKQIASLEEYVLVSPDGRMIEVYRRRADRSWSCEIGGKGGVGDPPREATRSRRGLRT